MVVSAWLCLAYFSWHTHTANMTSSRQIKPHFYLHRNFCAPYRELKNLPMIPDCGWAKEGSCNCQALVWILLYYLTFYFILYLSVLISNFWIWIWHCTVWLLVTWLSLTLLYYTPCRSSWFCARLGVDHLSLSTECELRTEHRTIGHNQTKWKGCHLNWTPNFGEKGDLSLSISHQKSSQTFRPTNVYFY